MLLMTTIITIISQMIAHHSSGTQDYISYVHYRPVRQHTALFCKMRPKITLFVCKIWGFHPSTTRLQCDVIHYFPLVKGLEPTVCHSSVQEYLTITLVTTGNLTLNGTPILAQPLGMYVWNLIYMVKHDRRKSQNTITGKIFSLLIRACIWAMLRAQGQRLLFVNILTTRSLEIRIKHLDWIKMTLDRSIWWECVQLWSAFQVPYNHASSA